MGIQRALISSICVLLTVSCKAGEKPATLSDADATQIIETFWNNSRIEIPTGNLEISHGLSGQRDPQRRRFNQDDLEKLKMWEAVGLVTIQQKKDLTKDSFSYDNWFKMTQGGVGQEILVTLTERGKALNTSGDPTVARIPEGHFSIERITSNDIKELEFTTYCLVTGLHRASWTQELQEFHYHLTTNVLVDERKFQALFKYDPIEAKWKLVVTDVADRNKEFSTQYVQKALQARQ